MRSRRLDTAVVIDLEEISGDSLTEEKANSAITLAELTQCGRMASRGSIGSDDRTVAAFRSQLTALPFDDDGSARCLCHRGLRRGHPFRAYRPFAVLRTFDLLDARP